jgi:hypothetical protein
MLSWCKQSKVSEIVLLHRLSKIQAEATTNAGASKSHRAEMPARPPGPPARFSADSGSFGPVAPRRNNWPRGVTASTLDSESSDRGSNPCGLNEKIRGRELSPGLPSDRRKY